jgi:aryl-alcohol dehydrogenase-like predicted oxidoreductase
MQNQTRRVGMEYRNVGNSGLRVSEIGLGTNQFGGKVDLQGTKNIISAAVDAGVNLIDTADIYQNGRSEEFIGQAIKGKRDQVLIASKVYYPTGEGPNQKSASFQHIMTGVEDSLRRLDIETIDLYQVHHWDERTPIEETMRALDLLIQTGKVRYIGASNFSAWQLTHANAVAELAGWARFISIQPHYNMLVRDVEKELLPACEFFKIGILPYFPLAGGFLTGKYLEGEEPPEGSRGESSQYVRQFMSRENFQALRKLKEFSKQRGRTINHLAHAWLLAHPMVSSVISGATRVEHVLDNTASAKWSLSPEEFREVESILGRESE